MMPFRLVCEKLQLDTSVSPAIVYNYMCLFADSTNLHQESVTSQHVQYHKQLCTSICLFAGCHSFDQSTLAVLLSNAYSIINHCVQLCVFFAGCHRFDQSTHIVSQHVQYHNHCVQLCLFI